MGWSRECEFLGGSGTEGRPPCPDGECMGKDLAPSLLPMGTKQEQLCVQCGGGGGDPPFPACTSEPPCHQGYDHRPFVDWRYENAHYECHAPQPPAPIVRTGGTCVAEEWDPPLCHLVENECKPGFYACFPNESYHGEPCSCLCLPNSNSC